MLGVEETASLMALLKSEQSSLDEIMVEFNSKFTRSLHIDVCRSLALILESKEMLKLTQRLIALGILIQAYSSQPGSANPFISSLIDVACHEDGDKCERSFVLQLFGVVNLGKQKEIPKQSVLEFIRNVDLSATIFPSKEQLQQLFSDKSHSEPFSDLFKNPALKNVLLDPDVPPGCDPNPPDFGLLRNMSPDGLKPQWIRPLPPRLPVEDGELKWRIPDNNHEIMWGHSMCADNRRTATIRDLISKALKVALPPAQQQQFVIELNTEPKLVYQCGLTPKKLPDLVENNPLIAVEVLIKLIDSSEISEYYTTLANMDMSWHSMKVVNKLTMAVELPKQYVHMYMRNCISSCVNVKDKYMQNRLVRFVCVFFQSLIQNNYIVDQGIFIEVHAFCTEFFRIREAAELFRLLKSI